MNIEQKAKAYDEALKRAQAAIDIAAGKDLVGGVVRTILPELRESEDERIGNVIYCIVRDNKEVKRILEGNGVSVDNALAYLEKQKERGPLTKEEEYILHRIIEYLEDETCPSEWISLLHDIYCLPYEKQKEAKWSPSEGEMGVLYKLCYVSNQITDEDDTELTRLYQDLKREYFNGHSFENMFSNEKQKEQNDNEGDFTIYHPLKNGKGEYECIPYSFYGSLTSFSEDKDLIDFLRTCFCTKEECKEWIERQKEQKPKNELPDYDININDLEEFPEELLKHYNELLIDAGEIGRKVGEIVSASLKKHYILGLQAGKKESNEQKEQKPADDTAFEKWLDDWYQGSKEAGGDVVMSEAEFKNWSRGIKNMYQQKPVEWSEEDEKNLENIRLFLLHHEEDAWAYTITKLKSLRPQPHWKPNEYTLSLVKKVANGEMLTHMEQMAMETLCNDLQKLL